MLHRKSNAVRIFLILLEASIFFVSYQITMDGVMRVLKSTKLVISAVILFSAGTVTSFPSAADPEMTPSNERPDVAGDRQKGNFGDPDQGYFGNPDEGHFHSSQFATVPSPTAANRAATGTVESTAPKISQGSSSPYVKLDDPAPSVKPKEEPTATKKRKKLPVQAEQ